MIILLCKKKIKKKGENLYMKRKSIIVSIILIAMMIVLNPKIHASLTSENELIRIHSNTIDYTITNNTSISDIISVFGEPKITTDSAFGGHAYTFYTDSNYSNFLYIETLAQDNGIISFGTVSPGYEVLDSGYDETIKLDRNWALCGYELTNGTEAKVKGGIYYNWNKWVNRNATETINLFIKTYKTNPSHYLKGISEHSAAMYNAICAVNGYTSNMKFDDNIFYINEQMKQNGKSLREYAIQMNKKQYVEFIGTRFEFDMKHPNGYYLLNPAMYASMFYEYGTNRHNYVSDYAVMDYDIDNQLVTAIGINKDLLKYYDKIPLTSSENTKLERARNLYMTSMQSLGTETENIFLTTPIHDVAKNLRAGELKPVYKTAIVAYFNAIRAGQGLSEVTQSANAFTRAQHMAVLNSYIVNVRKEEITHSPNRTTMLNDGVKEDFFNTAVGYNQISMAENIAWANNLQPSTFSMRKYINQLIDDSSEKGLTYSHRLSLLHPTNSEMGYGIANSVGTMEFLHDLDYLTGNEVVTWPSTGVTLLETLDSYTFNWSAQFYNGYLVRDTTKVNVKCLTDGRTWTFDKLSSDYSHYFVKYYQSGAQEQQNRVIFGDSTLVPQPGFVYEITVTGLKNASGNTVSYSYRSVFEYGDVSQYGTPASNIAITPAEGVVKVPNQNATYYAPIGEETDFNVTLDSGVKDIKVTWETTDTTITLTQNGTVIVPENCPAGKRITIKVSSDSSGASTTATVVTYQKKNKVKFNPESLEIGLNDGEHKVDIAGINGNLSATNIEWKIASELNPNAYYDLDDPAISEYIGVRVSGNSAYVTAKSLPYGNNKFRLIAIATTNNGIFEGYIPITVNNPVTHVKVYYNYKSNLPLYSVSDLGLSVTYSYDSNGEYYGKSSLSYSTILSKTKSNDLFLRADIEPKNAPVSLDAEWNITSGQDVISKKDENGSFTINKYGRAVITAKNKESGVVGKLILNVEEPIKSLTIKGSSQTIYYDEENPSEKMSVTTNPAEYFSDLEFKSSNPLVATVDNNGIVTFTGKAGNVTITAKASTDNSVSSSFDYIVKIPVTKLTFNQSVREINVGSYAYASATPSPNISGATNAITYTSSDTSVATVSGNGQVYGQKPGHAVITATIDKSYTGGKEVKGSYDVYVLNHIDKYALSTSSTIYKKIIDAPEKVSITTTPHNSSFAPSDTYTVEWSSSDDSIATVSSDGVVTPKSAGRAKITATITPKYYLGDTEVTSSVRTLSMYVVVQNVSINLSVTNKNLNIGGSTYFSASLNPQNTDLKDKIEYSVSDNSVVSLDTSKMKITAKKGGRTILTAKIDPKYTNGVTIKSEVEIIVTNHVTNATLSGPKIIYTGNKTNIYSVILTPQDYSDEVNVTWSSSNPQVATVNEKTGVVTPIKPGSTLIQATVIASYMNGTEKVNSLSKVLTQNVTVRDSSAGFIKGDMNADTYVNSTDAAIVLDIFKSNNATNEDLLHGDMNEDNLLNSIDAAMILDVFKNS